MSYKSSIEYFFKIVKQKHGNIKDVISAVSKGADVNSKNEDGETVLMEACEIKNNMKIVKYLVENGAKINTKDICGETAL